MFNECTSTNKRNLLSNVKTLLDNYGFSHVFYDPYTVNLKTFHVLFKCRAIDVFKQTWCNEIVLQSSMCSYKFFKSTVSFESYLDLLPKNYRIVLSKLRLSSHRLSIETGRHGSNRLDRHERVCNLCTRADIEDEFHFVLICPIYLHLRKKYIKIYCHVRPSMYKFVELLNSKNPVIIKKLGHYIYEAFSLRNEVTGT